MKPSENDNEFLIEKKHPYEDRHFFVEEDLNEKMPATDEDLRQAYNPHELTEAFEGTEEVEDADIEHDAMATLRLLIKEAIEQARDMSLDTFLEKARSYGERWPWPEELDYGKKCLHEMTTFN